MPHASTRVVHTNPFWEYRIDRYHLHNGREADYYYVHSRGSAMVIPITERGTFLWTRQFRYLDRRDSLELPCGGIKPGASPDDTARDELAEEAGVAGELERIGQFNPCNGVTNETCHVFVARELRPSPKEPDESELIEVVELTAEQISVAIRAGEVWDGMSLAAWALFRALAPVRASDDPA